MSSNRQRRSGRPASARGRGSSIPSASRGGGGGRRGARRSRGGHVHGYERQRLNVYNALSGDAGEDEYANERRFDRVENYQYELPENFEDEEIDEDEAFGEEDYAMFGDIAALNRTGPVAARGEAGAESASPSTSRRAKRKARSRSRGRGARINLDEDEDRDGGDLGAAGGAEDDVYLEDEDDEDGDEDDDDGAPMGQSGGKHDKDVDFSDEDDIPEGYVTLSDMMDANDSGDGDDDGDVDDDDDDKTMGMFGASTSLPQRSASYSVDDDDDDEDDSALASGDSGGDSGSGSGSGSDSDSDSSSSEDGSEDGDDGDDSDSEMHSDLMDIEDDDDDDEDEAAQDARHESMLELLKSLNPSSSAESATKGDSDAFPRRRRHQTEVTERTEENEFSIAASAQDGFASSMLGEVGAGSATKLTMSDLLQAMGREASGYAGLKKQLSAIRASRAARTLDTPLEGIRSEEITRAETYAADKQAITNKWSEIIQTNRRKEQITFPLVRDTLQPASVAALTTTFEPSNDLEADLGALVKEYGLQDDALAESERRQLAKLDISEEEVKKREGELRRMRQLLFYHEQKMRRINKIKSKSYRRMRKKMREKNKLDVNELAKIDPELAQREREKLERARIQERMSLKHKRVSKWAKRNLAHNRALASDKATRQAIGEQLNMGQRLMQKIQSIDGSGRRRTADGLSESDEDEEDEEEEDEDSELESDEEAKEAIRRRRQERYKKQLEVLESELEQGPDEETMQKHKGLFGLKFMQRAMEKQKADAQRNITEAGAGRDDFDSTNDDKGARDLEDDAEDDDEYASDSDIEMAPRKKKEEGEGDKRINVALVGAAAGEAGRGRRIIDFSSQRSSDVRAAASSSSGGDAPTLTPGTLQSMRVGQSQGFKARVSAPIDVGISTGMFEPVAFDVDGAERNHEDSQRAMRSNGVKGEEMGSILNATRVAHGDATQSIGKSKKVSVAGAGFRDGSSNGDASTNTSSSDSQNPWARDTMENYRKEARGVSLDPNRGSSASKSKSKSKRALKMPKAPKEDRDADADADIGAADDGETLLDISSTLHLDRSSSIGGGGGGSPSSKATFDLLNAGDEEQAKLVKQAFALDDDLEEQFEKEKRAARGEDEPQEEEVLPGWGSWAGLGAPTKKRKRHGDDKKHKNKLKEQKKRRADDKLKHVIINEKRDKKLAQHLIPRVPRPFKSREQYERSIRNPIGPDWNALNAHQSMIKDEVTVMSGKIVNPIEYKPAVYALQASKEKKKVMKAGSKATTQPKKSGKLSRKKTKN